MILGFTSIFCIYLYFYISPIIKDKDCVAPHRSTRLQIVDAELGKVEINLETPGPDSISGTDIPKERRLWDWVCKVSHRLPLSLRPKRKTEDKVDKRSLYQRCSSNTSMTLIELPTPPPPAYASRPSTPPVRQASEPSSFVRTPAESSIYSKGELYSLPQRPSDVQFVSDGTNGSPVLRTSQARRSVLDSTTRANAIEVLKPYEVMICDRNPRSPGNGGRIRSMLPGGRAY